MKITQFNKKYLKGFTLIELLIATAIFVMVMIVLSQVYVSIVRSERIAYALLNAENSLRNNLELIARSIRMGKNFEGGGNSICFDYYLPDTDLNNNYSSGSTSEWKRVCYIYQENNIYQQIEANKPQSLFDSSISITQASFRLLRDINQQTSQITVLITLRANVEVQKQDYTFNLQTAITPRIFIKEI